MFTLITTLVNGNFNDGVGPVFLRQVVHNKLFNAKFDAKFKKTQGRL
jgi:hypothetical protein